MESEMREIGIDELKEIQIRILDFVSEFCEKNGINYWIDTGTLLGAVRHKGYIPWDDDIDIGMLRDDYDRFIKSFGQNESHYKLLCCERDKNCVYSFGKVYDERTLLYEPDENGIKLAVNIDVFVYDNAPDDKRALKRMYFVRDFYQMMVGMRMFTYVPRGGAVRRSMIGIARCILKPFIKKYDLNYFALKQVKNCKKYIEEKCEHVGNFTSDSKIFCSKDIFNEFIELEFEGKMYKAPKGYDDWLRAFYGNYMELPPEEKRVSAHRFKAFVYDEEKIDSACKGNTW